MANANRVAWVPDEKQLKQITKLSATGLTVKQVAYTLGVGASTFFRRQQVMPEVKEAMDAGRAMGIAKVTNALFDKAMEGDNVAMIFYLKNRDPDNWEDVHKRRITGADGGDLVVGVYEVKFID